MKMSRRLTTEQVCFDEDCAKYCMYGLGTEPRPIPQRFKAPPFHDFRDALEHIGRLTSTWSDKPGICSGVVSTADAIQLIWKLGAGLGMSDSDKARMAAVPALRDAMWSLLCRLVETQASHACTSSFSQMDCVGAQSKNDRMLDAIEAYHIRRRLRIAHASFPLL